MLRVHLCLLRQRIDPRGEEEKDSEKAGRSEPSHRPQLAWHLLSCLATLTVALFLLQAFDHCSRAQNDIRFELFMIETMN